MKSQLILSKARIIIRKSYWDGFTTGLAFGCIGSLSFVALFMKFGNTKK